VTTLHALFDEYGQSPWIDNIRRDWLSDGTLARLVSQGVRGVTSNPAIFAKAFATSSAYDEHLVDLRGADPEEVFEALAVGDVRDACDVLGAVHEGSRDEFRSGRRRYCDGYVSLEVSPRLARDGDATVEAARRLATSVGRANVMIKIPATKEGLPAVTQVLGSGINVNVTLIFSIERYDEVITAWLDGLQLAQRNGHDLGSIASVASFFVSRVDAAVDALLPEGDPRRGTTANAQVAAAYRLYRERMGSPRTESLLWAGAQVQRPLWASTSTKNPSYYDLLYVDYIVGDETVNTMPDATLAGVLDHGNFRSSLLASASAIDAAAARLNELPAEVPLRAVTDKLEFDGVSSFVDSYEELLATVSAKLESEVARRLLAGDVSLVEGPTASHSLGWLRDPERYLGGWLDVERASGLRAPAEAANLAALREPVGEFYANTTASLARAPCTRRASCTKAAPPTWPPWCRSSSARRATRFASRVGAVRSTICA
jgi:transaldolase